MLQTSMRMDKNLRDALDEIAKRLNCKRSDVIRSALDIHASTRVESYVDREISYEGANLEEAKQALGRVLTRWRQHRVAADQQDVSIRLSVVRDLVWTAFEFADAIGIDDRTAAGPVPQDRLSAALNDIRDQLYAIRATVERAESGAAGHAELPEL